MKAMRKQDNHEKKIVSLQAERPSKFQLNNQNQSIKKTIVQLPEQSSNLIKNLKFGLRDCRHKDRRKMHRDYQPISS